jgi:hypothetical protein
VFELAAESAKVWIALIPENANALEARQQLLQQ